MIVKDETRVPEMYRVLDELSRGELQIGILGDDKGGEKHKGGDITVLGIAIINEFGLQIEVTDKMRGYLSAALGIHLRKDTKYINIPERSFIRGGYDSEKNNIINEVEPLLKRVIGLELPVDIFYDTVGELVVGKIQEYLTKLREPPNHPATVANKGSSNPLIGRTGQLRDSITFKVGRK